MTDALQMNRGDLIVIYRTSDKLGPADYRSVVTSVCVVEEVKLQKILKVMMSISNTPIYTVSLIKIH